MKSSDPQVQIVAVAACVLAVPSVGETFVAAALFAVAFAAALVALDFADDAAPAAVFVFSVPSMKGTCQYHVASLVE